MQRTLSLVLTVLLAVGLAAGIWFSVSQSRVQEVRGLIGSEKEAFFADPQVQDLLRQHHKLKVQVTKAGSREIAGADLSGYDFAFPSGTGSAEAIRSRAKASQVYDAFYTPLVVASWDPVVGILQQNGLSSEENGIGILDMREMVPLMESGKRWNELQGADAYPSNRSVLLSTTDVRKSNSAAMYLALTSYLLNGEQTPQMGDVAGLVPQVSPLFLRQGYQENSSAGPFEDYLALGAGKAPAVVIYESQYLEKARAKQLPPASTVLYPKPTIFTKHVLVPLDAKGDALGKALSEDPELQNLAARYGFRTRDANVFAGAAAETGIKVPATIVDMAQEPNQAVQSALIEGIEQEYQRLGLPAPAPDPAESAQTMQTLGAPAAP